MWGARDSEEGFCGPAVLFVAGGRVCGGGRREIAVWKWIDGGLMVKRMSLGV